MMRLHTRLRPAAPIGLRAVHQAWALLLALAASPAAALDIPVPNGAFSEPANEGSVGGGSPGDEGTLLAIGDGPWLASFNGAAGQLPPPTLTIGGGAAVISGLAAAGSGSAVVNNGGAFDLIASDIPLQPFTRYELDVQFDVGGAFSNEYFPQGNGGIALTAGQQVLVSSQTAGPDQFVFSYVAGTPSTFRLRLRYATAADPPPEELGIRLYARPQQVAAAQLKPTAVFRQIRLDVRRLASEPGTFVPTAAAPLRARQNPLTALLPDGRVLIAGGFNYFDPAVGSSAELFDPATGRFTATGTMGMGRFAASATPLSDGRVLLIGGPYHAACEFYDPATGLFTPGPELAQPRVGNGFTTTTLADGHVLITGGFDFDEEGEDVTLPLVDRFDPVSATFEALPDLGTPRSGHTATLLADGRVLIAGGYNASFSADAGAELYDPATGTTTPTGSLTIGREGATAVMLADGRVLIAGGYNASAGRHQRTAEIYDPASGTFARTSDMAIPRYAGTAKLLPDGRVLIAASVTPNAVGGGMASDVAEIFDPETGSFSVIERMIEARDYASTILLPDGRVLFTSGFTQESGRFLPSAEVYSPLADTLTAGPALLQARAGATTSVLADGRVLVVGGDGTAAATAEIVAADGSAVAAAAAPIHARVGHVATTLADGRVLITGGGSAIAELFDPQTAAFRATGALDADRYGHTATLLADGKVLVAGGTDAQGASARASVFDPASGAFVPVGTLQAARSGHAARLLPDGRVLLIGGGAAIAELYDPAQHAFVLTGAPTSVHAAPTATLLGDGKVLVIGGAQGTAELYDPDSETFVAAGRDDAARTAHVATMLGDGRVLVAGGGAPAALYDPVTGQFGPAAGGPPADRGRSALALLADGRVLLAGGEQAGAALASTLLYEPGRGAAVRPHLDAPVASFIVQPFALQLSGRGFRGSSRVSATAVMGAEASGGTANGAGTSATNFPLVQLRHRESGRQFFVAPDPAAPWSDTAFQSRELNGLPLGEYGVTVTVNGIASVARRFAVVDGTPRDVIFRNGFDMP